MLGVWGVGFSGLAMKSLGLGDQDFVVMCEL